MSHEGGWRRGAGADIPGDAGGTSGRATGASPTGVMGPSSSEQASTGPPSTESAAPSMWTSTAGGRSRERGSGAAEEGSGASRTSGKSVERTVGERGEEAGKTTRPMLEALLPSRASATGPAESFRGNGGAVRGASTAWRPRPPAAASRGEGEG